VTVLPASTKWKITSSKFQIANKFQEAKYQAPNSKRQINLNEQNYNIETLCLEILKLNIEDLFEICHLSFVH